MKNAEKIFLVKFTEIMSIKNQKGFVAMLSLFLQMPISVLDLISEASLINKVNKRVDQNPHDCRF